MGRRAAFVLYVEGPRDQSLLAAWATRLSPQLGHALDEATVILGGCQPARAAEQFRALRANYPEARGVCLLDRDADGAPRPPPVIEPGLDFFTWGRRHIESYLLVPGAIRRSLARCPPTTRASSVSSAASCPRRSGLGAIDAKSLFAFRGEFQRLLGRPVRPAHVARAMHAGEIHPDVLDLLRARPRGSGDRAAEERGVLALALRPPELRVTRQRVAEFQPRNRVARPDVVARREALGRVEAGGRDVERGRDTCRSRR